MTNPDFRPVPTVPQLIKASGSAALIAGVALVTAILPAEYGVDPTGIGKALGLTQLHSEEESTAPTAPVLPTVGGDTSDPVSRRDVPYRTQEMSVTLAPNKGAEIKALMKAGEEFVFNWTSDAPVNFDMHGEPPNAKGNEFSSYWQGVLTSTAHGSFTAPFDGTHGWYWRNRSADPVTVTVTVSGFFEKLYLP